MNGVVFDSLPLPVDPGLLVRAAQTRRSVDLLLGEGFSPRDRMLVYYQDMQALCEHGAMVAIDLVVDVAFVLPDEPAALVPGLVVLDEEALAARVRDMVGMRSRGLN